MVEISSQEPEASVLNSVLEIKLSVSGNPQ